MTLLRSFLSIALILFTTVSLFANEAIVEDPSLVNSDPAGEGWFFKLELKDAADLDSMMSKDEYDAFIS